MNNQNKEKIIKELNQFRIFKKDFSWNSKKIIQKENNLYCEDELLQIEGEKPIGETEKWINVGYRLKGDYSKVLSNLFPYKFIFRGKELNSIESFFQGIKMKDITLQNEIFQYSGIASNVLKIASDYNWQEEQLLYWQGIPMNRHSKEYIELVEELYISAIQNPLYRNILKKVNKPIIHSIGKEEKEETVFTRYEFEEMLNTLVAFLKEVDE